MGKILLKNKMFERSVCTSRKPPLVGANIVRQTLICLPPQNSLCKGIDMSKKHSFIICAVYGAVVVILSALLFAVPKDDFSPRENRMLATMPRLSAESLINGEFSKGFSSFCADRFPLRTAWLTLNSSFELGLGKLEAGGVMLGADQNLIKRLEYGDLGKLEDNLRAIDSLCQYAESKGGEGVFFCAPRSVDVLESYCPPFFDPEKSGEVWKRVKSAVTVTDELRARADSGEYVFYKTDHHWTTLGAYYAYRQLGEQLGFDPYPLSDFTAEAVCEDFLGTSYSSSLMPFVSQDTITAYRYEGDGNIRVTDALTEKSLSLYHRDALKGSSKYDFFLGGNRALLRIESKDKPRLILVKDSFANSLIPFLARHFNIDAVDPRYLREPFDAVFTRLCDSADSPRVLILFGIDTLTADVGLVNLQ